MAKREQLTDKLTPRQARFVEEYLVDLNGTQAAIRAGYSARTANEIASQNLTKLNIQTAVAAGRAAISQRVEITQDMVAREFAKLGFSDIRRLFDKTGALKPLASLGADDAAAIASVEVVTRTIPGRDGEAAEVEYVHKIRAWDKVAALTQLGRHLGMFVEKTQQLGANGQPVDPPTPMINLTAMLPSWMPPKKTG